MIFYKLYHTKVVDITQYKNLPLLSNTLRYYMLLNKDTEKSEIIDILNILLDYDCDPYMYDNVFIYDIISCQDDEIFNNIMSRIQYKFDINMVLYSLMFESKYISNFFIRNVYVKDQDKQIEIMYRLMLKNNISGLQYCLEKGYSITSSKTDEVIKYYSETINTYLLKIKNLFNSKPYIHKDIVEYQLCNYLI